MIAAFCTDTPLFEEASICSDGRLNMNGGFSSDTFFAAVINGSSLNLGPDLQASKRE